MTKLTEASLPIVEVNGLPITACTTPEVRRLLADAVSGKTGICRIATINLDFLRLANEQPELRTCLLKCEHLVPDGWPVLELARLAHHPLPERVTGADLVPEILSWARPEGWRVALIGGLPETKTALVAKGEWSDVVCGHWLPNYRDAKSVSDPALCAELRVARADIVLVALGFPKQEFWLHANLAASGARAGLGVGGSLELLAGIHERAPWIFQKLRLEFLFRMIQEPRRLFGRYWRDWLYWHKVRKALAGKL